MHEPTPLLRPLNPSTGEAETVVVGWSGWRVRSRINTHTHSHVQVQLRQQVPRGAPRSQVQPVPVKTALNNSGISKCARPKNASFTIICLPGPSVGSDRRPISKQRGRGAHRIRNPMETAKTKMSSYYLYTQWTVHVAPRL